MLIEAEKMRADHEQALQRQDDFRPSKMLDAIMAGYVKVMDLLKSASLSHDGCLQRKPKASSPHEGSGTEKAGRRPRKTVRPEYGAKVVARLVKS